MSEVMLPWPEPRRPRRDQDRPVAAPHYEIQRVNQDGSTGPVELLPVTRPPWHAAAGRRGFLGAGIASSVAAALLLSGCKNADDGQTPAPSVTDSPDSESPDDSPPPDDSDTSDPGGGGVICSCNKVCTCIPVCQAHRLLDPDPVVRHMAQITVLAMGLRELAYLRWAAASADAPLRARIEELIAELRRGRRFHPDDLGAAETDAYEPYLDSNDPVIALMAAQVLCLRTLRLGTRLTGDTADRTGKALAAGARLAAWTRAMPETWGAKGQER